ncbi:MAG: flagellar type III secretion system pore protein FliP [Planctomycetes bacterium]|nr:flagellar type III secretion system pore protein FliP [Planctomycetota bacterium]
MRILATVLALSAAVGPTVFAQPAPGGGAAVPTLAGTPPASPSPDSPVDNPLQVPDVSRVFPAATTREGVTATLKIFVIMTVLTLAPAILMMTTSFTRILIVLAMLRQALGVQQLPPSQVLVGISLFLTFLVMAPTYQRIHAEAIQPWLDNAPGMTQAAALDIATRHLRDFMFNQIERTKNEEDIYLFLEYSRKAPIPANQRIVRQDVGTEVLIPAFILSELKTSFVLGFRIYLPFLVIDMVIATVLISMGMLMLPPVLISLPFMRLLFVLADGWHLVVGSLLAGFA